MSLPNSVLRRYTPPTCTLEIAAKGSPLSHWAGRPVLKHLRFQLSFDDPRLTPEEQVQITGDRAQLEALCEAVDRYVQNFLDTSPTPEQTTPPLVESLDHLDYSVSDPDRNGSASYATRDDSSGDINSEGNGNPGSNEHPGSSGNLGGNGNFGSNRDNATTGIYLQPKGLLSHDLHLGELVSTEPNIIQLSALQLFDLASALDEYTTEAIALPVLNRPGWLTATPAWAKVAAALVLAVGVTTAIVRFVDPYAGQPAITAANSESASDSATENGITAIEPDTALDPLPLGKDATVPNARPLDIPLPPSAETLPAPGVGLPSVGVPQTPPPNAPAPSAAPELPNVAIAPPAQRSDAPGAGTTSQLQIPTESEAANDPANAARSPLGRDALPSLEPAPQGEAGRPSVPSSTAFDTIPQVAEARSFFQERWQPPESLDQTLEYRLQLGPDGSIQRIIPLGRAAGDYIDRTGMPLPGEPFVSPVENGSTPQIRIVLDPNGRVQTFLESP
jgi:hypothetical protein